LASVQASAQTAGFALDRFDPAERGSDWFGQESLDLRGHLRPAVGATLEWAHDPLVFYDARGRAVDALVENQFVLHVGGALTLWNRVRFGLDVPLLSIENGESGTLAGESFRAPAAVSFGDIRVGGDVRLFGKYGDRVTVAAGLQLAIPTGSRDNFTSDGSVRLLPRVMVAGKYHWFEYAGKLGAQIRTIVTTFANAAVGPELQFGAAAGARVFHKRLLVGPELNLSSVLVNGAFFERKTTPLELLFGAHYTFLRDFRVGAGVGPGLSRGYGTPEVRALISFDWAPAYKEPARAQEPALVAPPPRPKPKPKPVPPPPPPPPPDRDGDSIPDKDDACPDAPGPTNPDPQKNGCPQARIEKKQILILDQVKFETGSAKILSESDSILEAVARTLHDNPEIKKIRVEGHTDDRGAAAYNKKLSDERAASVVEWLVKRGGVNPQRLESKGFGKERPIDSNATERGRFNNRRVEFHILSE
jgi:outer membrane protein OmpA-like peptidoglycan-associated protein